ncbi:homoprotocatechuate degradation operon regulator HpaR [uncultured Cohaesibacter sp.]|uniref:homoprotocatechuate degradation operon regulator HpaR n=1 Tax=uncultured Cohaesibacter sp. TaxID=1002546 RepID=UPI0029C6FB57|nr:homoprotocatechuate degradation operon regulator HpaR [uncultured Cohaesibacter sp.]
MTKLPSRAGTELSQTQRTLPIALLRAREAVMDYFRPLLAENDVTEQQWRVMRVLDEVGTVDASFLARQACILAPSLTRIMRTLEARGFVEVNRDSKDGRRALVCLSEEGSLFIRKLAPASAKIYEDIESKVGNERIGLLLDELEILLAALNKQS